MSKYMSKQYNPGKIKPIIKIVASLIKNEPHLKYNTEELIEKVEEEIPALKDKTKCANCDASMVQYAFEINVLCVALVIAMAREVKENTKSGMLSFTESNRIHIPTLNTTDAIRHKTTNCAKLGLIAKYIVDGKQVRGIWVITKRGFEALRGEEVPTGIIIWRGDIIERPGKTTTFQKVQAGYNEKVSKYLEKHNEWPKNDYHEEITKYNNNEWIDFAGYHWGNLF